MAERIVLDGRVAMRWLTALPSTATAPTQTELTGGTNLVGSPQGEELTEVQGFEPQTSSLPTPGYASRIVGNVAGEQSYGEARLSFYYDTATQTIYTALADGTSGFIFIGYDGLGAGEEGLLYPASVASRVRRAARNAPHIFDVNLSLSAPYVCTQAA